MENNNNISNFKKNESSFLDQIDKKNEFYTPHNYFKSLPEVIQHKTLKKYNLSFSFDILSYKVLAPTLMILLMTFFVFDWNSDAEKNELTNEQLSEVLIESDYLYFDDELLYEVYSESLTEEEKDNEYIDYLINNNIELNTIIEEL